MSIYSKAIYNLKAYDKKLYEVGAGGSWDLMSGELVAVVQRGPLQYPDYLQGLLQSVLHPLLQYQVDGIIGKHYMELFQCK